MEKRQNVFNGKKSLKNVCNPALNRQVGVAVEPVWFNEGVGTVITKVITEVPSLNTDESAVTVQLDAINETVSARLQGAADDIQAMVDELLQHKERLLEQKQQIDAGELDLNAIAERQKLEHWSQ